jgi:hypothetical protein
VPLECLAKRCLVLNPLGLGVDIGEADVEVLGPVWDQTLARKIEAAFAGLAM